MQAEELFVTTWIPRSTLHLREVHSFLSENYGKISLLPKTELVKHHENLDIDLSSVVINERNDLEVLSARLGRFSFSVVEDGIFSLSEQVGKNANLQDRILEIQNFYQGKLGPALAYLFSRGAPLPKELSKISDIYPLVLVVREASPAEIQDLFQKSGRPYEVKITTKTTELFLGTYLMVVSKVQADKRRDANLSELVSNIVFYQEFYRQLKNYLDLHRSIWDRISKIRESEDLRYKDFPAIRHEIMDIIRTLLFAQARLLQMKDIARVRMGLIQEPVKSEMQDYGLFRFESILGDTQYIIDLWDMTIKYAQGTLELLESLFQENTQRELSALKFVTFVGVLTGFFGMNIAFPWEERWFSTFPSSITVIVILAIVSILFYWLLSRLIYHRHFKFKESGFVRE